MGDFLKAAYNVLRSQRRPLSAREIASLAVEGGILITAGKTPWQTMKSKLSIDILKHKERSVFMRTGEGLFALREWSDRFNEQIADRFKKALFDEDIVVIPALSLIDYAPDRGLHQRSGRHKELRSVWFPMRRREAEDTLSVIQLVSVFLIRYRDQYLTYKRTKRLPETRLHGYYSMAFGGHLNPDDMPELFDILSPEQGQTFLMRELHEEVVLPPHSVDQLEFRGLLYDDSQPVSRQHLGIVYLVRVKTPEFRIGERGFLIDPKYESLQDISARITAFENWSALLVNEEALRDR